MVIELLLFSNNDDDDEYCYESYDRYGQPIWIFVDWIDGHDREGQPIMKMFDFVGDDIFYWNQPCYRIPRRRNENNTEELREEADILENGAGAVEEGARVDEG